MKARLRERWLQLPRRDRQLCAVLAVFLLIVVSVYGLWLPARQRLATRREGTHSAWKARLIFWEPADHRLDHTGAA